MGTPPANLIAVEPQGQGIAFAGQPMDASFALDGPAQAMFRPEDLGVSDAAGPRSIAMEFAEASPVAGRVMVTGTRGDLRLTAVVDKAPRFAPGDTVHFTLPDRPAALFTLQGERLA